MGAMIRRIAFVICPQGDASGSGAVMMPQLMEDACGSGEQKRKGEKEGNCHMRYGASTYHQAANVAIQHRCRKEKMQIICKNIVVGALSPLARVA